jgi:hypothetical protein
MTRGKSPRYAGANLPYLLWKDYTTTKLLCVALCACPTISFAGSPPAMTKIVFSYVAPDLPVDSPSAKPKTMYLAEDKYARVEEEPVDGGNKLIIVNEPDVWLIDAVAKAGTHSVNSGPDFTVHNPIIGPDDCPEELFAFEFGREVEFLKRFGAKSLEIKEVDGTKCETWEFEAKNYLVTLDVDTARRFPVRVKVFKSGTMQFQIRYVSYESRLPFDLSLFEPPKNVHFDQQPQ